MLLSQSALPSSLSTVTITHPTIPSQPGQWNIRRPRRKHIRFAERRVWLCYPFSVILKRWNALRQRQSMAVSISV